MKITVNTTHQCMQNANDECHLFVFEIVRTSTELILLNIKPLHCFNVEFYGPKPYDDDQYYGFVSVMC